MLGNLELNNFIQSIGLLSDCIKICINCCIVSIEQNIHKISALLNKYLMLVTVLR